MVLLELGRSAAESAEIGQKRGCPPKRMIGRAMKRIEETHACLSKRNWDRVPPAVEWFLDNIYLVRREGRMAELALKTGKRLRWTEESTYIQVLAKGFLENAWVDEVKKLEQYLLGIQEIRPLTEEELCLFPAALKGELCRRLAGLCGDLERGPDGEGLGEEMEGIFTSLRILGGANLGPMLERTSIVEGILRRDPAGIYEKMDESTRARYRARVCRLAAKKDMEEWEVAERALELSRNGRSEERHIGWFLFRKPLGKPEKKRSASWYVGAVMLPPICLSIWLGIRLKSWAAAFLLLLPLSDLMKNLVDFLAVRLVPPRPVLRMELKGGIPAEARTLCVIAGLLSGEDSGTHYAALLERYCLANRDSGRELKFGLLADLPDRGSPMGGEQRAWVEKAEAAIQALNKKYGGGFFLLFRQPIFQKRDERYVGWERKRGALLELARLLRGEKTSLMVCAGNREELEAVCYVITLDSDTSLNVGAARELVGAMTHPLNRPKIDEEKGIVTEGYGLLQPRIGVELNAANRSWFSRIFAGLGGIDPYGGACSDVYHDLFDRGTYTGKGIFDVDAYLCCLNGRFPQERILSHDLIEGAYLHGGLLEDVELTDGYPYRVTGYFSRLHRWVRGDWQLLPWLGKRVWDERGRRVANPISGLDKWKLFDNLRRSLSPVLTLLSLLLGMWLSMPAFGAAAAVALTAAGSNLLLSGAELAFRGGVGVRRRYHGTIVSGLGGMILQILLQLLFLPYQAWICGTAIVTALWRSWISHRKMLEWTTAADVERRKSGLWAHVAAQWPAVLVGFATIVLAKVPAGAVVGFLWILSPLFSWFLSRPLPQEQPAPAEDRPFLLHQAGLLWGYFQDWLRPEDHWLPPDNVQEKPWLGPARRTSPTNIGMALLSCVAAADLEFVSRRQAGTLICHMLDTLEGLTKWKGHLYNWYDTASGEPLYPRYVSTVDSGNLRGSLIALREALCQWGEDELARRAEALAGAMDLSLLYDGERKLFRIGYDLEKGEFTSGWYDLLASEARLASYIAVALGEVEPRHWRRLGRGLVGDNDYCGMLSWTGTMFEYFMPNLLLPCEPGSLMYESLSFCVYAQKRWGSKTGTPWGVSESGYYNFDPGMAYQYKAHGVQTLGLKRGLDQDVVVAPYASFLALLLAPKSAGRNLRRLRDMGLEGRYGLFEAVDFTPERLHGERWAAVSSFMAHHVGMSLVAIDNALNHNVMQERFLRDRSMEAFRELLQEKVPVGVPILKPERENAPERPNLVRQSQFCRSGMGYDLARPACHLFSNGVISALCTDAGEVRLLDDRGEVPVLTRFRERYAPAGISFFFRDKKGKLYPLTGAPFLGRGDFQWQFESGGCVWERREKNFSAHIRMSLPEGERGALWTVTMSGDTEGELVAYLEPVLMREADHLAHPAYGKLSLESYAYLQGVGFARRSRERGRKPAMAFLWNRREAFWDTDREKALGRGGLRSLKAALARPAQGTCGAVLDPCLLVRFPLTAGKKAELRLALGLDEGKEQAWQVAEAVLSAPEDSGRLDGMLRGLQLSSAEGVRAMELLSDLFFSRRPGEGPPQSALWGYGISGDLPIAAVPVLPQEEIDVFLIKAHRLLTESGFAFDLVYLTGDGGDYLRPCKSKVLQVIKAEKREGLLGKKGGIHVAEWRAEDEPLWQAWAAAWFEKGSWKTVQQKAPVQPPEEETIEGEGTLSWHFEAEGEFTLQIEKSLPPLGWSHFLVNPALGWLTDETGCGHLWKGNAREEPITPWNNDPLAIGGPEWFRLEYDGETHSLFAAGDGLALRVTYGFGWMKWEKHWPEGWVTTTALVPWTVNGRYLLIEIPGGSGELKHTTEGKGERRYPFGERLCLFTDETGTRQEDAALFGGLLQSTRERWEEMVKPLKVETPDEALNHYLNGWVLYQVIACRLLGRTSRYQNGGAYGFRDQLQDILSLLPFEPEWAREQILRCCAHQFEEGDVQHWWHEVGMEKNRGVRTRISDDLLWLPYALEQYLKSWDDWDILSEQVNYLTGEPLKKGERERYFPAEPSPEQGDVYGHSLRAIRLVLERGTGPHGLLKMGTGDWNDGMNEVGVQDRGESVWLTWFAICVLEGFLPLAEKRGDAETEEVCRLWADKLRKAAEEAWDGEWYLRGWYDNGEPLGSRHSKECQIDSIAQSWAVFAGGDREKSIAALRAALERLVDENAGIVRLFTPPFDRGEAEPGYIKAYLPGIRENGGQYTHGAVWLALACLRMGWTEEGYQLLRMLLPATHDTAVYQAEPYVLAGDVYDNPAHRGRGGWSWYTGGAGWYCQAAVGELLGLNVSHGILTAAPRLPESWPGWQAQWKTAKGTLHIAVKRGTKRTMRLDEQDVKGVLLSEIVGEHRLLVTVPENKKKEN